MNRSRDMALLGLYCAMLFLWRLGARDFWEPAEGRCAQVAREMLRSGDWLRPTINGAPYLEKPPLFHWLVAASFWVTGRQDEFTARLPAALAGVLCVIAVFELARRTAGRAAGWCAALTLALSAKFMWQARSAEVDVLLTLWVLLAYDAIERARHDSAPRHAVQLGIALGLSVLTKGLVGPILVLVPLGTLALASRFAATGRPGASWVGKYAAELLETARPRFGWGRGCLSVTLTLVIGASWYTAMVARDPSTSMHFWQAGTFQTVEHHQPVWYYLLVFPASAFPGALGLPWLFRGVARASSARARGAGVLAAGWLSVPLLLLSAYPSKQSHYLLPMLPAMALLMGQTLAGLMGRMCESSESCEGAAALGPTSGQGSRRPVPRWAAASLAVGGFAAVATGIAWHLTHSAAALGIAVATVAMNRVALRASMVSLRLGAWTAGQWTIAWLVAFGVVVPGLNCRHSRKPFLEAVRSQVHREVRLASFHATAEQIFYLDRPVQPVRSSSELPGLAAGGVLYFLVSWDRYEIYRDRFSLRPVLRASQCGAALRDPKDDLLLVHLEPIATPPANPVTN